MTLATNMFSPLSPWLLAALLPVALVLGAWAHHQWTERSTKQRRRAPQDWPLGTRPLMNSEEMLAWKWLERAFHDHHIMVKLPVTRFTLPRDRAQSMHWYNLLGSVYCTFTICTADGRVVGCLDLPGKAGLPRSSRTLKQSLLSQCSLPYWIIRSDALPSVAEIRAEFLGETTTAADMREREQEERAIIAAKSNLRTALIRQRSHRHTDLGPLSNWPPSSPNPSDQTAEASDWHDHSFLVPLDSRRGELH